MLTLGKTGCGTSGSLSCVDYFGVTECVNGYGISGKLCVTYSTVNYVIVATVSLTSRINVVLYNGATCGVTECCYSFLSNESLATYGAMLTFGKTVLGTSGSYCLVDNLGMTECVNGYCISGKLCVTYGTVNYVIVATVSLTSRINVVLYNDATCGVTKCCYSFLCNECLATY